MQVYLVLALIFSIAIAVFAVQNATRVDITLLFWQIKNMSLVLVIFGSALIGALAAALFGAVKQFKSAKNLKSLMTEIESQTLEIEYLNKKLKKLEKPKEGQNTSECQS